MNDDMLLFLTIAVAFIGPENAPAEVFSDETWDRLFA